MENGLTSEKKLSLEEIMAINGKKIIDRIKKSWYTVREAEVKLDINFQGYLKGTRVRVMSCESLDNDTAFKRYDINEDDLILTSELIQDSKGIINRGNFRIMKARRSINGELYASPFIDKIKNENIPEPTSNPNIFVIGKVIEML